MLGDAHAPRGAFLVAATSSMGAPRHAKGEPPFGASYIPALRAGHPKHDPPFGHVRLQGAVDSWRLSGLGSVL